MRIVNLQSHPHLDEKINKALNLALFINRHIGESLIFDFESPLTLLLKISSIIHYGDPDKIITAKKIYFSHPIIRSKDFWNLANIPNDVKERLFSRNRPDNEQIISDLRVVIEILQKSNFAMRVYCEKVLEYCLCQHNIEDHLKELICYLSYIITDYRTQGFSRKAVDDIIKTHLFGEQVIPPKEIITKFGTESYNNLLREFLDGANLKTQLEGLFYKYDYPLERFRYFSKLENVKLPSRFDKNTAINYNNITFFSAEHPYMNELNSALSSTEYFFDDDYISSDGIYVTYDLHYKPEFKNIDYVLEPLRMALLWFNHTMSSVAYLSSTLILVSQESSAKLNNFALKKHITISTIDWSENKGLSSKNVYDNPIRNHKLNLALSLNSPTSFYDAVEGTKIFKLFCPDKDIIYEPQWEIKDRVVSVLRPHIKFLLGQYYSAENQYDQAYELRDDDDFLSNTDILNDKGLNFIIELYRRITSDNFVSVSMSSSIILQRTLFELKIFRNLYTHKDFEQKEMKAKLDLFLPSYYRYVNERSLISC